MQASVQALKHPDMQIQDSDEECGLDWDEVMGVCSGSLEYCPDARIWLIGYLTATEYKNKNQLERW